LLATATLIVPDPTRSEAVEKHVTSDKHLLSDMGPSISFCGGTPLKPRAGRRFRRWKLNFCEIGLMRKKLGSFERDVALWTDDAERVPRPETSSADVWPSLLSIRGAPRDFSLASFDARIAIGLYS
jgi:hypothetical protein